MKHIIQYRYQTLIREAGANTAAREGAAKPATDWCQHRYYSRIKRQVLRKEVAHTREAHDFVWLFSNGRHSLIEESPSDNRRDFYTYSFLSLLLLAGISAQSIYRSDSGSRGVGALFEGVKSTCQGLMPRSATREVKRANTSRAVTDSHVMRNYSSQNLSPRLRKAFDDIAMQQLHDAGFVRR